MTPPISKTYYLKTICTAYRKLDGTTVKNPRCYQEEGSGYELARKGIPGTNIEKSLGLKIFDYYMRLRVIYIIENSAGQTHIYQLTNSDLGEVSSPAKNSQLFKKIAEEVKKVISELSEELKREVSLQILFEPGKDTQMPNQEKVVAARNDAMLVPMKNSTSISGYEKLSGEAWFIGLNAFCKDVAQLANASSTAH